MALKKGLEKEGTLPKLEISKNQEKECLQLNK